MAGFPSASLFLVEAEEHGASANDTGFFKRKNPASIFHQLLVDIPDFYVVVTI